LKKSAEITLGFGQFQSKTLDFFLSRDGQVCDPGWYLTRNGHCDKCVDQERSRIVVLTIGIVVIFFAAPLSWGVLYWMVADKESSQFLIYIRLLIDHFQLLSINTGIRTAWPWELQDIYHASESAGLNLDFLEMECAFGWKYSSKYNIFLMLPVFFFGEILLITSAVRLICYYRIREVSRYVAKMDLIASDRGGGGGPLSPHARQSGGGISDQKLRSIKVRTKHQPAIIHSLVATLYSFML
jgi:hypothetical protein